MGFHYNLFLPTGSDRWKVAEKKLFNKGIAIYKKDFFLVQKLVSYICLFVFVIHFYVFVEHLIQEVQS